MLLQNRIKHFCATACVGLGLLWPALRSQAEEPQDAPAAVAPAAIAPADVTPAPAVSLKDGKPQPVDKNAKEAADEKKPADQPADKKKEDAPKDKPAAARAAAPRPIALTAPAAANNALQQQVRRVLEPMLKVELSFAARAADLDADERRVLVAAGKEWFDSFLVDFMKNQDPNQQQMLLQGGRMVWFGGQRGRRPEMPRDLIRAGMIKVVAKTLPKEKAQAYADECAKRDEFDRKVAVDNMVAQIDERVILSPDQRQKVTKLLNEHWKKNEKPQVEAFAMYGSMWAGVGDNSVFPVLSEAQQAVLKQQDSTSGRVIFGGGMFGNEEVVIDDIELDADNPKDDTAKPAPMPEDPDSN